MPDDWLLSLVEPTTTHDVLIVDAEEAFDETNIMIRLEPFFGVANRSLDMFKKLNDALVSLNSLQQQTTERSCMPVCFSFFKTEFSRFSELATTNTEVAAVLRELCESLESAPSKEMSQTCPATRRSIVDPGAMRIMGPRTTSTSARVDGRARAQRTHMVDDFHVDVLDRTKKPSKQKRRHMCSICHGAGRHPQTCKHILASENTERANLYFKRLIQKNKVHGYLDVLAKRGSQSFVGEVRERIQALTSRSCGDDLETSQVGNGQ